MLYYELLGGYTMKDNTEIEYQGEILCDTNVLIAALGGPQHKKLFESYRYGFKYIQPVLKINEGEGTKAYFLKDTVGLIEDIEKVKGEGLGHKKIWKKFNLRIKQLSAKTEALKRQFELDRKVKDQIAHADFMIKKRNDAAHGRPDIVIKDEKGNPTFVIEIKMQEIENELKTYFKEWNGSMSMLSRIREKIDELETLQARDRVAKTISQMV